MTINYYGTIVIATLDIFSGKHLRDQQYLLKFPGGIFLFDLIQEAEKNKFLVMGLDEFKNGKESVKPAYLVSDMGIGLECCGDKLSPGILWALESPIVSTRFYNSLNKITEKFPITLLWSACNERVSQKSNFEAIFWPNHNYKNKIFEGNKEGIVAVTAYKRHLRLIWIPSKLNLYGIIRAVASMVLHAPRTVWIKFNDPWVHRDNTNNKFNLIKEVGLSTKLDIYGNGWDKTSYFKNSKEMMNVIKKCYKGVINGGVKQKLETISKYKFCICYENIKLNGYITEKIFDAIQSRVIPVYSGAPDIENYVWPCSFINADKFSDVKALVTYINSLSLETCEQILHCGERYLNSDDYSKLSSKNLAKKFINKLKALA
ncbi:hypothetical protein ICV32_01760 [Polynucleobacter sp. MWH-UH24A]|uniref:glycosyltransferase family 10 domain-containing protein n=1 Tax=Polynucleobacter sp. MWH-UH24A TaxID=2689110 RepID=UPI001BFE65AB|nr:glycosyltransferase family 10 [Polynucleobacter sp. MWH-UH24A]QWD76424.1 hypothetical protein ICV32_01760 [Polynucleobacter sp. MWH-UH24A]